MQTNSRGGLPVGFISLEKAVELIKSDSREEPKVDIGRLVKNLPFLHAKGNFTIFLIKRDKDGNIVSNGNKPVQVPSDYDKVILEKAIIDKYSELTRRAYDKDTSGIHKISTSVTDASDDRAGNPDGRPGTEVNTDSKIKVGDVI